MLLLHFFVNNDRFNDPRHIEWAKKVKQRDKFTCRVCGAQKVYLHSHHLNAFAYFVEDRFNIANGITLCSKCHDRYHQIYGSGRNTYIQFKEFLDIINTIKEISKEKKDEST